MPVSKAQQRATAKYNKTNYDSINLRVPKGRKQEIQDYAKKQGETLNSFINRLIDDALQK